MMNLTKEELKHDLRRNISSILAGTTMLNRKISKEDVKIKEILEEMGVQCENTLKLIENLFENKIEIKMEV